ncbi:elongin BC and Polycomb repressive complex 2-associated protein-like [Pipistrellus kuhlii]|uniref:elongin BC and Polycomb repressive complex 2-associated protein-like n=1 Tax=Pipistrellus kuhlii TaxID=59472 RepID=UPI001E274CE4|nr:elongin BC and Polycomb repressive complex 2-associated protein-like [Pipistrellus kuhlii]
MFLLTPENFPLECAMKERRRQHPSCLEKRQRRPVPAFILEKKERNPRYVPVCARAGGRAGEGGAGGAARPARRLRGRPRGRLLPHGLCSARPNLASRPLAAAPGGSPPTEARGGGRGGPARPSRVPARPPVRLASHKAEPGGKEQPPERDGPPATHPAAPRAPPRTRHQPRAPTYLAEGAAAAAAAPEMISGLSINRTKDGYPIAAK